MGVSPINTFDAFNLKAGTEYKFRVTPRNRYGWGESVVTTDTVAVGRKVELPEFTRILPGQLKALQGSSIRLECQVTVVQIFSCMYLSRYFARHSPLYVLRSTTKELLAIYSALSSLERKVLVLRLLFFYNKYILQYWENMYLLQTCATFYRTHKRKTHFPLR
jgi:hypothetical protein